ncbi:imidazolonepropionase [Elusimicrobiota bacterium]
MNPLLIKNPNQIITMASRHKHGPRKGKTAMNDIGALGKNHSILIDGAKVGMIGETPAVLKNPKAKKAKVINAEGKIVLPGFIDSHTHIVFGGERLDDFVLRSQGASYEERAKKGGGILKSVRDTREASREELLERLEYWCSQALKHGATTVEIKTGYGLSFKDERKLLDVINEGMKTFPIEIIPTFLGGHAVPPEFKNKRNQYIKLVIKKMLPAFNQKARFFDVFCEKGYFTHEESKKMFEAAKKLGYSLKIHAEQLNHTDGIKAAIDAGCVSADHLDFAADDDIKELSNSNCIATLLPASNLFLKTGAYPKARAMIDGGAAVALATDFNPGTSPTLNLAFVMSLAVTQMGMTPEEAIAAVTVNAAHAIERGEDLGIIKEGKQADIVIFDCKDYREIPYYMGMNMVSGVIKKGHPFLSPLP